MHKKYRELTRDFANQTAFAIIMLIAGKIEFNDL
jgi:hypothetical protein